MGLPPDMCISKAAFFVCPKELRKSQWFILQLMEMYSRFILRTLSHHSESELPGHS